MSYVIVEPELLAATAADVASIGSTLDAANAAAAAPTTGLAALGVDEISAAISGLLSLQGRQYQAISAQLAGMLDARIVQAMSVAAQWYAGTETAIAASLHYAERQLQGVISLLTGRPPPSAPSASAPTEPSTPTTPSTPTSPTTPAGLSATYTTASQWDGGFTGKYTITNSGAAPVTDWQLQFTMPTGSSLTSAS